MKKGDRVQLPDGRRGEVLWAASMRYSTPGREFWDGRYRRQFKGYRVTLEDGESTLVDEKAIERSEG